MFCGEVRRDAPSESSRAGAHRDGSDGERRVRKPLLGGVRAHSKRQAAVNGEGSRAAGIRHEAEIASRRKGSHHESSRSGAHPQGRDGSDGERKGRASWLASGMWSTLRQGEDRATKH